MKYFNHNLNLCLKIFVIIIFLGLVSLSANATNFIPGPPPGNCVFTGGGYICTQDGAKEVVSQPTCPINDQGCTVQAPAFTAAVGVGYDSDDRDGKWWLTYRELLPDGSLGASHQIVTGSGNVENM